jgi:hypothetical protein
MATASKMAQQIDQDVLNKMRAAGINVVKGLK